MKVIKLMLVCAAALFVVASVAQAAPTHDDFYVILDGLNMVLVGGGSGYNGGMWYYYPSEWWNQWFYDDPLDPDRWKLITYDMIIVPGATSPNVGSLLVEVAINWSD